MKNPKGIYENAIFNPIVTKDIVFGYQHEFRIYNGLEYKLKDVKYIDENARKFPIGDLRNIAQAYPVDDLFSGVEIELNVDWVFCRKHRFQSKLPKLLNTKK